MREQTRPDRSEAPALRRPSSPKRARTTGFVPMSHTPLPGQALALQRAAGNRVTARVLARWARHPDEAQKGVMLADDAAAELLRLNPPQNK